MWFLGKKEHFCGEIITSGWWMITFEGHQYMWTNPSQKSRQGSDPPHPGNAWILGTNGPAIHPLGMVSRTNSYNSQGSLPIKSGGGSLPIQNKLLKFSYFLKNLQNICNIAFQNTAALSLTKTILFTICFCFDTTTFIEVIPMVALPHCSPIGPGVGE